MEPSRHKFQTELQQAFRFYLKVDDLYAAYIVNVSRPEYTVSTQDYKLLNYYFNHPTEIKWNPISFTIREIFSKDSPNSVGKVLMNKLTRSAYDYPNDINTNLLKDLSKSALIESLGSVTIQMLDPDGEIYEEWKLHGAFITSVKFSQLDYGSDALTDINVNLSYDWAELEYK
jgi:hypothetical protein